MHKYNLYMNRYTTIRVSKETHSLLLNEGTVADSIDSVIKKLIVNQHMQKEQMDK